MKVKALLFVALFLGTFTFSFAQGGKGKGKSVERSMEKERRSPEDRATKYTNLLEKKIMLSADQKTKIYDINLSTAKQKDELREKYKTADNRKGMGKEIKSIDETRYTQIQANLSEEQKTKLAAIRETIKKKREAKRASKGKGKAGKPNKANSDDDNDDDDIINDMN